MFHKKKTERIIGAISVLLISISFLGLIASNTNLTSSYLSDMETLTGNFLEAGTWNTSTNNTITTLSCGEVIKPQPGITEISRVKLYENGTVKEQKNTSVEIDKPNISEVEIKYVDDKLGDDIGVLEKESHNFNVGKCGKNILVEVFHGNNHSMILLNESNPVSEDHFNEFQAKLLNTEHISENISEIDIEITNLKTDDDGAQRVKCNFCPNISTLQLPSDNETTNQTSNQTDNETTGGGGSNGGGGTSDEDYDQVDLEDGKWTNTTENSSYKYDLRLSDSDEWNQDGVNSTWSMKPMYPGDEVTETLVMSDAGSIKGDQIDIRFVNHEIDPGCINGTNEESDDLCGAGNMSAFLKIKTLVYNGKVYNLSEGGDFVDTNSNGFIDLQDLAHADNVGTLNNLKPPNSGVKTLTLNIKFSIEAGSEYIGDIVDTDVVVTLRDE